MRSEAEVLANLEAWTRDFEAVMANHDSKNEAEVIQSAQIIIAAGREAWRQYLAVTGGAPDPGVQGRTPALFFWNR